jgi:hypothetical protein
MPTLTRCQARAACPRRQSPPMAAPILAPQAAPHFRPQVITATAMRRFQRTGDNCQPHKRLRMKRTSLNESRRDSKVNSFQKNRKTLGGLAQGGEAGASRKVVPRVDPRNEFDRRRRFNDRN